MESSKMETVLPGVFKVSLGQPEEFTPVSLRDREPAAEALASMSTVEYPRYRIVDWQTVE